jgi:hypothetical protein
MSTPMETDETTNAATHMLRIPAIASHILDYARYVDLPALCLSCKALKAPAERRLYSVVVFTDPLIAYRVCQLLTTTPRLASHVRTFGLYNRRSTSRTAPLPSQFWHAVHLALSRFSFLESLVLGDPSGATDTSISDSITWILALTPPSFKLRDAKIMLPWDQTVAAFVDSQPSLRSLQTADALSSPPPSPHPAAPSGCPRLQIFDGSLRVATSFLRSPLTHLQVYADSQADGETRAFVSRLASLHKTLRSLCIHDVQERHISDIFCLISKCCPQIRYLGVFSLMPTSVSSFSTLLRMGC